MSAIHNVVSQYLLRTCPQFISMRGLRSSAKIADILKNIDSGVVSRASTVKIKLARANPKIGFWLFKATGTSEYTISVKAVAPTKKVKKVSSSNVYVACSCPFWRFQGPEYHANEGSYLWKNPNGEATSPDIKDPNSVHRVCKHVYAALNLAQNYYIG